MCSLGHAEQIAFVDELDNPMGLKRIENKLSDADFIEINMRPNGGFAAMIQPLPTRVQD